MKALSRRDFLKVTTVTAGAAVLAACQSATPTPAEVKPAEVKAPAAMEGEIRMLTLQGPPVEPVQELILVALQAKYPKVKVKFEYDGAGNAERYYTAAASGTMPDVFFSADLWVVPFAKNAVSLDLKPYAEADPEMDLNDIFPAMLGLGTFNGQIHMIPSSLDVVTMYYNKTLFEQAGAELPKDTWTYEDLIAQCKKITALEKDEQGNPKYWGLSHTSNGVWGWWAAYYPWIVGYGGKILDGNKSTWSDPKTVEGIKAYTAMWTEHNIAQPLGMDLGGDSFRLGRAAIYTHIPGVRSGLRTDVGDKFDWDVELMPKMPDGKHRTGMGAWGLSAYGESKFKEIAYTYVKMMVSSSIQGLMARKEMATPLVKSVANDPSWMEGLPKPPTNLNAFVKGADDAVLPVMDYPADCGSFYAGELNQSIATALESILRGQTSVEAALKEIDETTQACLDTAK
jgi:multiple sugar transport system substrate-binding protein